jgi:hypothetical protein
MPEVLRIMLGQTTDFHRSFGHMPYQNRLLTSRPSVPGCDNVRAMAAQLVPAAEIH